ncbi:MAG: transcriptional regulator, LuxR family [Tardiphaga sp.]|jgi:LuxR family quorum sensing-dependent transcriptional regulator|nr:transcriptional regulator, LuxR family [Tardiphaga sp.]MDB5546784.1 transcriptional regulator, LuxR family [Tardiphaga sp.]MDB5572854.1 transcriptional regulator, LuxR family [Tardiphaga sp.]MDB5625685.1 transcriptional regulator, LuxR family [Tardiphaga sp.]MDB5630027.1 transcriptional regulator, LuxR family [Tardiphaga sp.]
MASSKGKHFQIALDAIERIEAQRSADDLNTAVKHSIATFGYQNHCFVLPRSLAMPALRERKLLMSWPQAWFRQYDRWAKDDAVATAFRSRRSSFRWSDLDIRATASLRVMEMASDDFDMKKGFGIPIFGLDALEAGVSFSGPDLDETDEANFAVELIGIYAFNHYTKLRTAERKPSLTPRQREMMKWVAAGKTAWDISVIMSVSQDTVNKTLAAAMRNLEVVTRAQAIAEALRRREIEF